MNRINIKTLLSLSILLLLAANIYAQIDAAAKRYVRIGSLQSHFSAYGA